MKGGRLARAALAAAALSPGFARAQEPGIVVTASRTATMDQIGGTTITRAELNALAPVTARDALDRVAGVRAFGQSGIAGDSFVSVRGGEPNATLVQVEGARVNDPTNASGGAFDFAALSPSLIDRIEIARGALSAVQGADALAGVINLRLRAPTTAERTATARVDASTRGEIGGDAAVTLGWQGGGLLLGAGAYDSGDLDPAGRIARRQALGRATVSPGPLKLALLTLHAGTDRRFFPESSGGPRLAVDRERQRRATAFSLVQLEVTPARPGPLRPGLRASWSAQTADDRTPAIPEGVLAGVPAIATRTRFERAELTADLRGTLGPLALAAGGEYRDELGRARGTIDFGSPFPTAFRIRRAVASGFGEATLTPATSASITAGVRYDAPSANRARWTGRVQARATPFPGGPALHAALADGFRLPSIYALAYPIIANPNLKPERATSAEVGLDWRPAPATQLAATAFTTRYRDLIDFDAENFTNVNRARVSARGVEIEATARPRATLTARAAVTYVAVTNFDGPPLRGRPDWRATGRLAWTPRTGTTAFLDVATVTSAFDVSVPTGFTTVRGHTELALGGGLPIARRLRLDATLRNLADRRFENTTGFPDPGRTLRVTLSVGG